VRFWDSAQNEHEGGILARSTVPAPPAIAAQVPAARDLAAKVAQALDYVGVLTLEFLPRGWPGVQRNGAARAQFRALEHRGRARQPVREPCPRDPGPAAGQPDLVTRGAVMDNLIGDAADAWPQLLADPANHLHLYGKAETRPGRKMGHVTRLVK
jgi:5-(carboxyamino)imidazole ribonucleotide synthase